MMRGKERLSIAVQTFVPPPLKEQTMGTSRTLAKEMRKEREGKAFPEGGKQRKERGLSFLPRKMDAERSVP